MKVPNGWKVMQFGELADFKNGLNFKITDSGIKLRFLGVGDFKDKSTIRDVSILPEIFVDELPNSEYFLEDEDLVFVRSNGSKDLVGRCVRVFPGVERTTYTGFAIRARMKSSKTTPLYINNLIQYGVLQKSLKRNSTGTNISNLNQTILQELEFLLPPLPEQKAIADLLSTWDSAIEKTERLIAAKEKRFQWLLDELINQNPDKANWKAHAFNSIFKQQRNKHTGEGQCEILSVTKDGIVLQSEYFNKEIASEDLTGYLIVDRDEFVMSGLNFWMGSVDFQTIVDRGLVSPAYKVYKVISKSIDMDFLKIFVRSTSMTNLLVSVSVQGASIVRRNLDKEMLENSVIKAPSLSKQKEIAGIIISAQKEIDLLKTLAKKYKQQKRGLMQKLLTGEWRVKVA